MCVYVQQPVCVYNHLEEGMLQSLDSSGALGRVPLAHGSHEINGIRAGVGYQPRTGGGAALREAELHLACQLHAFWPRLLAWRAHHTADLVDLICLFTGNREMRVLLVIND